MLCRAELERGKWQAIDAAESAWCLHDAEEDEQGELVKSLVVTLERPAVTESEVQWKKGQHCCREICNHRKYCRRPVTLWVCTQLLHLICLLDAHIATEYKRYLCPSCTVQVQGFSS